MISVTDARKGTVVEIEGQLYMVMDHHHIKMGRGSAQVRLRLRDLRAGHTIERTFQSAERLQDVEIERRWVQYLYRDDDFYHFMDQESFEQFPVGAEILGGGVNYLVEGLTIQLLMHEGRVLGADLPITVNLKIAETGPAFKGDTASGGTKPAVLETGITVQVPLYLAPGETIKVDTRTGTFIERV